MKLFITIITICFSVFIISCKKDKADESSAKHCWQLLDFNGNQVGEVCDKTEAELIECVNNKKCGNFLGGNPITSCNYYQSDGPKFCYQIGSRITQEPITESNAKLIAHCYYGNINYTKTDNCVPCQFWYTREKRQKKPAGNINYSSVTKQNYCGDTLTKIFQGKQIIRKDDTDSLIIIQFSNNGQNW